MLEAVLAGERRKGEHHSGHDQPESHLGEERAAGGDEGESGGQCRDDSVEGDPVDVHPASPASTLAVA
jgi:hypothetical protein